MLQKLKNHLTEHFSFLQEKRLLIAVSGGVDSMVLAHLFHQLNYTIGIAHCNFQLRGSESDLDEQLVKENASQKNIPFHSTRFNTEEYCLQNKTSTQVGARELRYRWFQEVCNEFEYDYILTAHHLNDVIETFFINLSRGTGIDGLTGIPPINNNIIRPLLPFSREEIKTYATKNDLLWREDKSNAETKYLRNKIRHFVVPEFYKITPNFEENFKTTIHHLHQSKNFIDAKINTIKNKLFQTKDELIYIQKSEIATLSNFEIYELFNPFGFSKPSEIIKLQQAQSGKEINSNSHTILVNRNDFILHPKNLLKNNQTYTIDCIEDLNKLPFQLTHSSTSLTPSKNNIALNLDAIEFPLIVRKWKEGDVFYPTGMAGKKKISKYFKDEKFSKLEKETCWLLCSSDDAIIWIIGHRADRNFTAQKAHKNTIYLKK